MTGTGFPVNPSGSVNESLEKDVERLGADRRSETEKTLPIILSCE